jgi:hypothetical protein
MSCGQLHEPGHGMNFPFPGSEPHHDHPEEPHHDRPGAGPQPDGTPGQDAPEPDAAAAQPPAVREPGRIRVAAGGAWDRHGYLIRPAAWPPVVDGAAFAVHYAAGTWWHAAVAAAVAGLTAEVSTEVRNHRRKRRPQWRKMVRWNVAAGTGWGLVAAAWTTGGAFGAVQWVALAGGVGLYGRYAFEAVKAKKASVPRAEPEEPPWVPPAIEPPKLPDPRLTAFTGRFCGPAGEPGGELHGVVVDAFRELPTGFMLEIIFPVDCPHHMDTVAGLAVHVARLYDVTKDDVAVGYVPENRTERRCQVVVRTTQSSSAVEQASREHDQWDGETTYNPATGTIDLGWFEDRAVTHYLLHRPRSGAAMGMAFGIPGSGKSTTMHVIAADAGQAVMCSRCGAAGTCAECDLHRMIALWMADPRQHGFSVWKGRADLTGWGPEGSLELLEFAELAAVRRAEYMSGVTWYDRDPVTGQRRVNTGQGWFDPRPGLPLVLLPLDELPALARHPDQDLVAAAFRIIANGINEWRKLGIHPLFAATTLDITQIRVREIREMIKYLNSIAHRVDEATSNSGGITGDPRLLPANDPGVGYTAGVDGRPGDRFHTKHIEESSQTRAVDIRHLAGKIAATPIAYDPGILAAMDEWGITHQQVFTEWRGRPQDQYPVAAPVMAATATAAAAGPGLGGLAYREDAEAVKAALTTGPGDLPELMQRTGLSLGAAGRALDALAAAGHVTKDGSRYAAA